MKLSELISGQRGVIVHIGGNGPLRRRLTEMGFVRGTEILVIKNAPLRDPIEYKIMDYEVSLRRREAMSIEVDLVEDKDGSGWTENHEIESEEVEKRDFKKHAGSTKKDNVSKPLPVIKVALVGNPNCGKTTIFNIISGMNEHTGNYSGVTVDVKVARVEHEGRIIEIADLPGTYSLSAFSPEERMVRDYLINEKPNIVVNVIDSTNLERNLYLTTQLLELEQPMILALNMYDELKESGDQVNIKRLGQLFAAPVVPTVGRLGQGIAKLFDTIVNSGGKEPREIQYTPEIENLLEDVVEAMKNQNETNYPDRYVAVKLVEGCEELIDMDDESRNYLARECEKIKNIYNEDTETLMAESRYAFVKGVLKESVKKASNPKKNKSVRIDTILTHKYWGLPIFFVILWFVFYATFTLGAYPKDWIQMGVDWLKEFMSGAMSDGAFKALVVDGIIDGVGSVIVFLPNIVILFFFISLMEDTGYMARAAFITDKLMHKVGLHGKSFIPLIIGFGCNVPAIMATRTIESRENRIQTMLIIPFMSCSARLPVYILIAGAFFPNNAANVLFLMYMSGILLAIGSSLLFKNTLFKSRDTHFVMEIPPYRIPTAKSTVKHMWNKAGLYLKKMGGVILVAVVIIWALGYYPNQGGKYEGMSYLERVGRTVEPVIEPLGFDWKMGVGLMSGLAAKEIVVSSMAVIYDTEGDLESKLKNEVDEAGNLVWTTAVAISFLVFTLIYFPCIAVVSAIRREAGSWKWALFMIGYTTGLAWIVSFVVYRIALMITG